MNWNSVTQLAQFLFAIGALPLAWWFIKSYRAQARARAEHEEAETRWRERETQRRLADEERQLFGEKSALFRSFVLELDNFIADDAYTDFEKLKDLYFQAVLAASDETLTRLGALLADRLGVEEGDRRDERVDEAVFAMREELNRHAPERFKSRAFPVSVFMQKFKQKVAERRMAAQAEWGSRYLTPARLARWRRSGLGLPEIGEILFGSAARAGEAAALAGALRGRNADEQVLRVLPADLPGMVRRERDLFRRWKSRCVSEAAFPADGEQRRRPADVSVPVYTPRRLSRTPGEVVDWGLKLLGVPDLWRRCRGEGVTVAVLDTGIDTSHPDLAGAVVAARDFTGSPGGAEDVAGHGTHCAGIIAARHNGLGVVGVAPGCRLLVGKVLNDEGAGEFGWIVQGLEWAVLQRADIISMSFGGPVADDRLLRAIRRAVDRGVIIVCAAGNDGYCGAEECISFPGEYQETIAVGSINREMIRSRFSSIGARLDLMAPGEEVFSTFPRSAYAVLSGTSMATPFVAGVAALALAKHRSRGGKTPLTNQAEMREHLTHCCTDAGPAGFDVEYGFGIVNPVALLDQFRGGPAPVPPPPPAA
ncbi:MAG: S8 family peptidase [Planctomycetes bacterium]|nr:S8 family peptidase [Planctomycetota bacterium]